MRNEVMDLKALRKRWRQAATDAFKRQSNLYSNTELQQRYYGMQIAFEQCAEELNRMIGQLNDQ